MSVIAATINYDLGLQGLKTRQIIHSLYNNKYVIIGQPFKGSN